MRDRLGEHASPEKGELTGPNPVDRGKYGSKIHLVTERTGLPLSVGISGANLHDSQALIPLVKGIPPIRSRKLTIETSWDGHGSVRAAFFVLEGTDFVVTHHEGDPPGAHVWTRKGGPADPATRAGNLLAALGVGQEAVSYSSWGAGTDLAHVPAAWCRGRSKPVRSRQDI